jgi:hypothetical protein
LFGRVRDLATDFATNLLGGKEQFCRESVVVTRRAVNVPCSVVLD